MRSLILASCALLLAWPAHAQRQGVQPGDTAGARGAPALNALVAQARNTSDLRVVVLRFNADRAALGRRYDIPLSPVLHARLRTFYRGWQQRLDELESTSINAAGRADAARLRARIDSALVAVAADEQRFADMQPLVPFARSIQMLQEARRERLDVEPMAAAQTLSDVTKEVRRLTELLQDRAGAAQFSAVNGATAARAADFLVGPPRAREQGPGGPGGEANRTLKATLDSWYTFHFGYDPLFTWWVRKPYEELTAALDAYAAAIRRAWPAT